MIFNGPFTELEKFCFYEGFDQWKVWKVMTDAKTAKYYAHRSDWPSENRLVIEGDFPEFVIALDEAEGYYPRSEEAKNRFVDKRSIFYGTLNRGRIVITQDLARLVDQNTLNTPEDNDEVRTAENYAPDIPYEDPQVPAAQTIQEQPVPPPPPSPSSQPQHGRRYSNLRNMFTER